MPTWQRPIISEVSWSVFIMVSLVDFMVGSFASGTPGIVRRVPPLDAG
jgi:hypothetical protein